MKYVFLIFWAFGQLNAVSQKSQIPLDEWDTLRLKTYAELHHYDEILQKERSFSDTIITTDAVVVTYYTSVKKKLRVVVNHFDANKCLSRIVTEYFNNEGQLEYESIYKKCCEPKPKEDERCFEFVMDYGRYSYDSEGRVILHVYHLSTPMTIKEIYTYSSNGSKEVKREKIREPQFWN